LINQFLKDGGEGMSLNKEQRISSMTTCDYEKIENQELIIFPYTLWLYIIRSNLTETAIKVYQYLYHTAQKSRFKHKEVKPVLVSREKLCAIFGLKKTAINNALYLLRQTGWIQSEARYHKKTGFQQASIFWVCLPKHVKSELLSITSNKRSTDISPPAAIKISVKENADGCVQGAGKSVCKQHLDILRVCHRIKKFTGKTAVTISRIPSSKEGGN
jgi:hypothetical protein